MFAHFRQSVVLPSVLILFFGLLATGEEPNVHRQIDEIFVDWDRDDSPGFAVAVLRNGQVSHQAGYGMANIEDQAPITPTTSFCVMSVSKSFASACIAIAMDQGHFGPDDDVRDYIPELADFGTPITIRNLITCRSGLRDFYFSMALLGRDAGDVYTSEDVMDVILRQKRLMFEPGSKWSYSNSDWFLLAEIIRRTTGQTWQSFADDHVFKPLGMKRTSFRSNPQVPLRSKAVGHGHNGTSFTLLESPSDAWNAAGGLWSTTDDMARWDRWLNTQEGMPIGDHLKAFLRDGSLLGNEQCLSAFPADTYRGAKRLWYTGGGMGYLAHYVRFPDHRLSIVVLGNNSTDRGWHHATEAVRRMVDLYLDDVLAPRHDKPTNNDRWHGAALEKPMMLTAGRITELQTYLGPYRRHEDDYVELSWNDGKLCYAEISRHWQYGFCHPMITMDSNRFRSSRGYDDFEMRFDDDLDAVPTSGSTGQSRPVVRVTFDDGRLEEWVPIKFPVLNREQLQPLQGEYYCDELDSVYRVSVEEGQVHVQYNFGRRRAYRCVATDTFLPTAEQFCVPIRFTRNDESEVTGFTLSFGRAGELNFQKRRTN